MFWVAMVIDISMQLVLYLYNFNPDESYMFYIISGVWGLTDAVWKTQLSGESGNNGKKSVNIGCRVWRGVGCRVVG